MSVTNTGGAAITARNPVSKVFVLGATGVTGNLVVHQLLARGISVVALVRDRNKFERAQDLSHSHSTSIRVVQDSTENEAEVVSAIEGCGAIVSVLGHSEPSLARWSKSVCRPFFMRHAVKHVIVLMEGCASAGS